MTVDVLIIGQGICGTFLSWFLSKAGKSVMVMDDGKPNAASRAASGVINPVTGRQVVSTWMIEELLPFCREVYSEMGEELGKVVMAETSIAAFAHTEQMQAAYQKRIDQQYAYVEPIEEGFDEFLSYYGKAYRIKPVLLLDLHVLMEHWRRQLVSRQSYSQQRFDIAQLMVDGDRMRYRDIDCSKVVFCNGVEAFSYGYWKNLPFTTTKGEALIVHVPGLPGNCLYKFNATSLVPWKEGLWWVGSTFEREYEDEQPTAAFRMQVDQLLKGVLKLPYKIVDHVAGIRPGCVERRPFVGWHPQHANVGILNGMGTKGCSIGPWFARELAANIVIGASINPLVDVNRFSRALAR